MPNYRRLYIPNSVVFITMNTYNKANILVEHIDIFRSAIRDSLYKFKIIAGVVMPNHVHMLIYPENIKELPKIIFSIKYRFSRMIGGVGTPPYGLPVKSSVSDNLSGTGIGLSESKIKKSEKGIWQRRYYDHIIRDENDLNRHIDYIHYNPVKHGIVKKAIDYPYSSFNNFVKKRYYDKNWCNFEDKNKINLLDYE